MTELMRPPAAILLALGPDFVKKDGGWVYHIRLFVAGELFLDHSDFKHQADAQTYCFETFGKDNYDVMYV